MRSVSLQHIDSASASASPQPAPPSQLCLVTVSTCGHFFLPSLKSDKVKVDILYHFHTERDLHSFKVKVDIQDHSKYLSASCLFLIMRETSHFEKSEGWNPITDKVKVDVQSHPTC